VQENSQRPTDRMNSEVTKNMRPYQASPFNFQMSAPANVSGEFGGLKAVKI
jgi:hypothetical protein